jgi:hypothetical protein
MNIEIVDASEVIKNKTMTSYEITGNLNIEIIDEDDVEVVVREKKEKVDAYFPYGSYSKERTYRDYWRDNDQDLLMSLVSIKVRRRNKKGEVVILEDIREFLLLSKVFKEQLIESFINTECQFVVYHDQLVKE